MTTIYTYNDWHLGDNLIHLNYLRRMAKAYPDIHFVHAAHVNYLPQLYEVVADLPNLSLQSLADKPSSSHDSWKNRKNSFYHHPERNNWVTFHLEHFDNLSRDIGLPNPIASPRDLLFDYPALQIIDTPRFDVLVVNSMPFSGQLPGVRSDNFDKLIGKLMDREYSILTTAKCGYAVPCSMPLSVSAIGSLSRFCKYIIGVATGPMWPTFNIWNYDTVQRRVILLEPERVCLTPNTDHAASVDQAIGILAERGIL